MTKISTCPSLNIFGHWEGIRFKFQSLEELEICLEKFKWAWPTRQRRCPFCPMPGTVLIAPIAISPVQQPS
jgi:hypothetical protein